MHSLEFYAQLIEEKIQKLSYPEEPIILYSPVQYIMGLGGKRLRPALTLLSAGLFTQDVQRAVPAALAVEIFHNFTLMHDDIMDNADIRRGKATVHKVWNSNVAILSGDATLILAYDQLLKLPDNILRPILETFNQTALEVCEGQQYDMDFETREVVTVPEYLEMIRLKTSVLIAAAMKIGAICAGASIAQQNALYTAGANLGLAFQLQDDYLDVFAKDEKFGKMNGGDIINNKKTYLLINALNSGEKRAVEEIKEWIRKSDFVPSEKVAAVKAIYDRLGTGNETKLQAISFINTALEMLNMIDVPAESKKPLEELMFSLMYREI